MAIKTGKFLDLENLNECENVPISCVRIARHFWIIDCDQRNGEELRRGLRNWVLLCQYLLLMLWISWWFFFYFRMFFFFLFLISSCFLLSFVVCCLLFVFYFLFSFSALFFKQIQSSKFTVPVYPLELSAYCENIGPTYRV